MADQPWVTAVGATLSRRERGKLYGGALYGGMESSTRSANVFLYSDPSAGTHYGYNYDGWSVDGGVFLYTGEGQSGNQRLTAPGNRALDEHAKAGTAVRLFVADGKKPGTQEKVQRYVGEFRVDPRQPYTRAQAQTRLGHCAASLCSGSCRSATSSAAPRTPQGLATRQQRPRPKPSL